LDDTVYLYDLTSTYFEARPKRTRKPNADTRATSVRLQTGCCGLVLDRDGFPKAHEVFDGNIQDRSSVEAMLEALEKRMGKKPGATVIVDRACLR